MMLAQSAFVAVCCALFAATTACDDSRPKALRRIDAVATGTSSSGSLLRAEPLADAVSKLKAASGPDTQALRMEFFPHRIVLQARDPKQNNRVLQYEFRDGRLEAPDPVELRGKGDLPANLFMLSTVNLLAIPTLSEIAVATVDREQGKVSSILVRRNLPTSDDVQFRVYVESPRKSGYIDADHNGKPL